MTKLPAITLAFWIMKIAATTLGETGGDAIAQTLNLGYLASSVIFIALFGVALAVQLRADRFHPVAFWMVVLSTSTAGTTISDFMNRTLGFGYAGGALLLTACLLVVFLVWRFSGQTFDVERIRSFRGELLYWLATLISNTLGTSSGDWLAHDTGLGFAASTVVITGVLGLVVAAHYLTPLPTPLLFWLAYVLTRPFGANAGNSLSKPLDEGGLGLGTFGASALLAAVLAGFLIHQTVRRYRRPVGPPERPVSHRSRPTTGLEGHRQ